MGSSVFVFMCSSFFFSLATITELSLTLKLNTLKMCLFFAIAWFCCSASGCLCVLKLHGHIVTCCQCIIMWSVYRPELYHPGQNGRVLKPYKLTTLFQNSVGHVEDSQRVLEFLCIFLSSKRNRPAFTTFTIKNNINRTKRKLKLVWSNVSKWQNFHFWVN